MIHSQTDQPAVDPAAFPFSAVTGHEQAKHALLLLAVEPRLRGVVISSAHGSAKSVLARGFESILPGNNARPFVELPLNATEDSLLGYLNLEATLATGTAQLTTGLLTRAHGGILYADDLGLLEAGLTNHIAAALDSRSVKIERDGISAMHPADFVLVATCDCEPRDVSRGLLDRIGLRIDAQQVSDPGERAEIIGLGLRFQSDPGSFSREFAARDEETKTALSRARALLPIVSLGRTAARHLAEASIRLGVEGNRADIFACRAARAGAALAGRREVADDDLVTAIKFVLLPRATSLLDDALQGDLDSRDEKEEALEPSREDQPPPLETTAGELILRAADSAIRLDLVNKRLPRTRYQSSGRRVASINSERGRARHAVHKISESKRVAVCATVRAAAPYQRRRKDNSPANSTGTRLLIEPSDLRFKKFKQKTGAFFIFAVDASGSMAVNRMAQAKGAMTRLLQEAYLHRDKVALISFRGSRAEVLLQPTRSVELAKRLVDAIPSGGATPVAAALIKALELTRIARARGCGRATLLLFTDGRANVALTASEDREATSGPPGIRQELEKLGQALQASEIDAVVIDTKSKFISNGEGSELARLLGGRYLYLPRASSDDIYRAVKDVRVR